MNEDEILISISEYDKLKEIEVDYEELASHLGTLRQIIYDLCRTHDIGAEWFR